VVLAVAVDKDFIERASNMTQTTGLPKSEVRVVTEFFSFSAMDFEKKEIFLVGCFDLFSSLFLARFLLNVAKCARPFFPM
jgi:hypothetical protein